MSSSKPLAPTSTPTYTEKLWPAWWIWVVVLGAGGALALAFAPISVLWSSVVGIIFIIVASILVISSIAKIEVTPERVSVGRASIEREFIGEFSSHRRDDAFFERGRGLNGTAFMCFRGWIDPVVKMEVTDERDATPYWLVSTRHPEKFVAALEATKPTA
ncbi:DUF3093 domain-containing protein [Neomicrococcus aestuarii]|uniref:DUF3093 domain-containing protein n=1 Tax=Neomicrococcus aestuarii TaxID=556325 RepID=A0A1L2ZK58_9MICC|nr:DUF3093 domain-containing protein [Neomicrococcus aestuarii]APF39775.1 hypothetical protein BHE16_00655 [Neomicrococcus aestuarii]